MEWIDAKKTKPKEGKLVMVREFGWKDTAWLSMAYYRDGEWKVQPPFSAWYITTNGVREWRPIEPE